MLAQDFNSNKIATKAVTKRVLIAICLFSLRIDFFISFSGAKVLLFFDICKKAVIKICFFSLFFICERAYACLLWISTRPLWVFLLDGSRSHMVEPQRAPVGMCPAVMV